MEVESHVHSMSEAELARSAQTLVTNAVAAAFNEDPVIGPDLSRAVSVIGSVVKRHGLLLQSTLATALAASGRFDVLVDVAIPIVDAASELLLARNAAEDLARINIRADASAERIVTVDLIVVDPEVGWAGVYDVKRGNGPVDGRTRRPIEHDLRAASMVLSSYLAKRRGYRNITRLTAGVIDYYGNTGFPKDFKVTREELDSHFHVPVLEALETVTLCLRKALLAELPHLFSTVIEGVNRESLKKDMPTCGIGRIPDPTPAEAPVINFFNSRPTGPGPRKQPMTAKIGGAA